ncbi:MAG: hypothetical protein JNK21_00915, partial [Rhodospirillaceae bacterium]|nr:hypothetical protein [Rhodospirillaceae bacterium]
MPRYMITDPGGTQYEITAPEGATEEEVLAFARQNISAPEATQQPAPPREAGPNDGLINTLASLPIAIGKALLGEQGEPVTTTNAVTRGVMDAPMALAQIAGNAIADDEMAARGNAAIAEDEAAYQARRGTDDTDWARLAGQILGTAPLSAIGGAPTTLGRAALYGTGTGGLSAALNPVTDETQPFWEQKLRQTGTGMMVGGIATPTLTALGKLAAPQVERAVKYLTQRGVRPTAGQMGGNFAARTEAKLSSVPVIGDAIQHGQRRAIETFNRAAYNEVLAPIGKTFDGPVGRESIDAVSEIVTNSYDDVLPHVQFRADGQFMTELKNLRNLAINTEDEGRIFDGVLAKKLFRRLGNTGVMDGLSFKQAESEIRHEATKYLGSQNPADRTVGEGLQEMLSIFRENLRRNNPQFADEIAASNKAYAMLMRVQRASHAAREGVFTPRQLLTASKILDKSKNKSQFA